MSAQSIQEDLLHSFSKHTLGRHALFFPKNYGNNKEPADLAWVSNRCAILFYATESRGSFEKMKRHNINQSHKWIKRWRRGIALRGGSDTRRHAFNWADIDHIVVVSVVSGQNEFCQVHWDEVIEDSSGKLCCCATLTASTIRHLARMGFTPRDLLSFILHLGSITGSCIPHVDAINQAYALWLPQTQEIAAQLGTNGIAIDEHAKLAVEAFRQELSGTRHHDADKAADLACDFTAADLLWLGGMLTCLDARLAPVGSFGPTVLAAQRLNKFYSIIAVAVANPAAAAATVDRFIDTPPGIVVQMIRTSPDHVLPMCVLTPREGSSALQAEASEARLIALRRRRHKEILQGDDEG